MSILVHVFDYTVGSCYGVHLSCNQARLVSDLYVRDFTKCFVEIIQASWFGS